MVLVIAGVIIFLMFAAFGYLAYCDIKTQKTAKAENDSKTSKNLKK